MNSIMENWHEQIFGKRKTIYGIPNGAVSISVTRRHEKIVKGKRRKKTICPHCATKNLVRESEYTAQCKKCGWSE